MEAIESQVPDGSLHRGARVDSLTAVDGGRWEVQVRGRPAEVFDSVVVALPAPSAAELLKPVLPDVAAEISEVNCRPAVTVNLFYDRELSNQEAAAIMGVSVNAMESLLKRARKRLREELKAMG